MKLIQFKNNDTNIERYIQVMDSEFQRIEQIIDEFLILAKPTKAEFKYYKISDILDEVIELLNAQANMKSIIINKAYSTDHSPIYCENNQLKQVFINLIKNAMDAIIEDGEITIAIEERAEDVVIQIIDNGKGISQQELEKLGSPFFTTKKNGTGLGLTICNRIIEKHKGSLKIESNQGDGTVMTIRLPI